MQEPGVDEPDLVKSNGEHFFTLVGGTLRLIDRRSLRTESELYIAMGAGSNLLLAGNRVVVVGQAPTADARTQVTIAEWSGGLRVVDNITISGRYVSARQSDGVIRLATLSSPRLRFLSPYWTPYDRDEAREHNRQVVEQSSIDDWVPTTTVRGRAQRLACSRVFVTPVDSGFGSTVVTTVDPSSATVTDATAIVADATELYASANRLYVATAPVDGDNRPAPYTAIHRFDTTGRQRTNYEATGAVDGHLLRPYLTGGWEMGQWSMSEHDGLLRVATTVDPGDGPSTNVVTVLASEHGRLVRIGELTGLGSGERIYAVRFLGPKGYVVTYRQLDPLYVLDLSDPRAPRAAGQLKLKGYTAYLHPIDGNLLLGLGQADGDEDAYPDGARLSLFDVSDPRRPKAVQHLDLGERWTLSPAESDHRAFLWWGSTRTAVVPLTNSWDRLWAEVVRLSGGQLESVGQVVHPSARDTENCSHRIYRSRVADTTLYTFSDAGIWAHSVKDVSERGFMRYPGEEPVASCRQPDGSEPPPDGDQGPETPDPLGPLSPITTLLPLLL